MLEFAAAFYEINMGYERLSAALPEDKSRILAEIKRASDAKSELEARLEPEGFWVEQELKGMTTVNLKFFHALKKQRETAGEESEASLSLVNFKIEVPMPPPPGVSLKDHLRDYCGELFGLEDDEVDHTGPDQSPGAST